MSSQLLLREFHRLAKSPDAVAAFRQLLLDLAVTGRLCEQHIEEGDGQSVLAAIADTRLRKNGRRPVEMHDSQESRPKLPPSWTWASIDQVSSEEPNAITDGPFGANLKTAHYIGEPGYRVIRLENIGRGYFRGNLHTYIRREHWERLPKHHVQDGDLVVAGLVDPAVRACEIPSGLGPALVKADCYRFHVHSQFSSRFALYYLNSPMCQRFAAVHHHGMTLTRLGLGNFRRLPIPVAPLAEQHRIAAKLDVLMTLCDELEAAQEARESQADALRSLSLDRVANSDDDDERRKDLRFFLDTSPRLITKSQHVGAVRQTIQDLAVRGLLVRQSPEDEPASCLLHRISERRTPPLRDAASHRKPEHAGHAPPAGWEWIPLSAACASVTDGDHQAPPKAEAGVPFLVIGNVRSGRVDFRGSRFVPRAYYDRLDEAHRPREGDVLYTLVGSYGIPVPVRSRDAFCVQRHIGILRPEPEILQDFLTIALKSSPAFRQATGCATGIAQKTVPLGGLRRLLIPLPPVSEQHRIVAKVTELMAVCDELETALTSTQRERGRLLESLLRETIEGATGMVVLDGALTAVR